MTHNTYLEILAENGIPALALFLAFLTGTWMLLRRVQRRAAWRRDLEGRRLATALQASLVIAVVSAIFVSEELAAPIWLFGGLVVVLARDGARSRPESGGRGKPRERGPRATLAPSSA